ncbi:MAG: hypothetical protein IID45_16105 [Planctomycetes bacterium]|nr:hypothetical protein [Planctomycetota bacterium]
MKTFSIFSAMLTAAAALVFLGWGLVNAQEESLPARSNPAESGLRVTSNSVFLAQKAKPAAQSGAKEKPSKEKSAKEKSPKEKSQTSTNPNLDANNRITETRKRLREYKSYATTIRQFIKIGDRTFTASGKFYRKAIEPRSRLPRSSSQLPPGLYYPGQEEKIRLELNLELNSGYHKIKGSLLQVCDGEVLMTVKKISGQKTRVTRRNVKEILAAMSGFAANNVNLRRSLICELGLGGVTGMLASLQKVMVFDSYDTKKIKNGKVYVMEGTWSPTYQQHWKGTTNQAAALPDHVPDRVRIIIDSTSRLRRIVYLKRTGIGKKLEPMITINFEAIKLNKPLSDDLFQFEHPTGVHVERLTKVYTRQLTTPQKQPAGPR